MDGTRIHLEQMEKGVSPVMAAVVVPIGELRVRNAGEWFMKDKSGGFTKGILSSLGGKKILRQGLVCRRCTIDGEHQMKALLKRMMMIAQLIYLRVASIPVGLLGARSAFVGPRLPYGFPLALTPAPVLPAAGCCWTDKTCTGRGG